MRERDRGWNDAATNQEKPGATGAGETVSPRDLEGLGSTNTSMPDLQLPEPSRLSVLSGSQLVCMVPPAPGKESNRIRVVSAQLSGGSYVLTEHKPNTERLRTERGPGRPRDHMQGVCGAARAPPQSLADRPHRPPRKEQGQLLSSTRQAPASAC